jgi:tRNA dimethylallyltransferase
VDLPAITLITGPTASGKSALALRMAIETGAEIVGADSMQLYAGLPILTAAPGPEEMARVPHHLVGVVDASEAWSVGRWLDAALVALADIAHRGKPAIVVGGTGLYFAALTRGLADIPAAPRCDSEGLYHEAGEAKFRDALRDLDPAAEARIEIGDRQRLVRAHAVAIHTGRPLSDWQADTNPALTPGSWRALVVEPPRTVVYERCDARFLAMVEAGALDEVAAMAARNLDPQLPALKAVGYRELAAHLAGDLTLEEAIRRGQQETRRYAKRQLTWLRGQTPDWERVFPWQGCA